jgi:mono/diheme cytochrome c family protein
MPGNPDLPSLSEAMHSKHAEETNDCYKCHPGPTTRCLRDVMSQQYGLTCISCHGNTQQVATSIEQGRRPWLDEPRCQTCHGANYAESPGTLYRNSHNGHGGLYCETCHSSTHAILPSREERDNRQNVALQGHSGTLRGCVVCHGVTPSGPGPHGYIPTSVAEPGVSSHVAQVGTAPNPMRESTEIRYRVVDSQPIHLAIIDAAGREVRVLTANAQTPGDHTLVWDGRHADGSTAASGVYFAKLSTAGQTASARLVKIGR